MLLLTNFAPGPTLREIPQARALEWLAEIHADAEAAARGLDSREQAAFAVGFGRLLRRVGCGPDKIGKRGHVSAELGVTGGGELYGPRRSPRGAGSAARAQLFAEIVADYFEREFADESDAPSELVHVTCTGYVAPSGAQRLVARKNWGALTHVTHAYHMGCYAAFPALCIGAGHLAVAASFGATARSPRVEIVHTELCTLHLDPSDHTAEQCVVQSLFGDGFIRYSLSEASSGHGFELLTMREQIVPDSASAMSWSIGDFGMRMTLQRDVPERIAGVLRPFVCELFERAGLPLSGLGHAVVAVHPGGPKIIDRVEEVLELRPNQTQTSRIVLFEHGNMSSATLPHVWHRLLADEGVRPGTLVLSLAFGPGLSVCGGLFRKH